MMISFFVGLVIVAVLGGAVAKNIQNNPTTVAQWRQAKRASKTRGKGKPYDGPSRAWIATKATGQMIGNSARRVASRARTRQERRTAKVKAAHDAAKARGETAATSTADVHIDRRGWRGALEDLREVIRPRPPMEEMTPPAAAETPREATEPPAEEPKPSTTTEPLAPSTAPADEKEALRMPMYAQLFEMSDGLTRQPFERIEQVHQFIKALKDGTGRAGNMYRTLAHRMSDKMSIDPIVTEPIERCGAIQTVIADLVDVADVEMHRLLNTSLDELLASGRQLPRHELLNGEATFSGALLVPQFFETVGTLAGRAFVDLRDLHCLIKALIEASSGQESHYLHVADRLRDDGLNADNFYRAARAQHGITMSLGDADTNMGRLLNMTVRELASSSIKAPNVLRLND